MASSEAVQPILSEKKTKATKRKAPADPQQTTKSKKAKSSKSAASTSRSTTRKAVNNGFGRGKKALENVHKLLSDLGVEDPERVSNCLKAGMLKGSVTLKRAADDPEGKYGLDQTLYTGSCFCCGQENISCTVRDVLYQPDYGGNDYEDGGMNAPVKCPHNDGSCGVGIYVTGICYGNICFDSGKFHNHCTDCSRFGVCIGDYREAHCFKCGKHYFQGLSGFPCDNCKRKKQKAKVNLLPMMLFLSQFGGLGGGVGSDEDSDEDGDDGGFPF